MKALAWIPERGRVETIDVAEPALRGEHDVALRMLEGGLCGTDREIVRNGIGETPPGCGYLIMGHESLAEVVECGRAVRSLRAGDLVSVAVRRPCEPACKQCARGRADLCESGRYGERGITRLHGMFADYLVERDEHLVRLPAEFRSVGVLIEPASVVEKALGRVLAARESLGGNAHYGRVLVLGAGPIGILAALVARLRGAEVWTVSREDADSRAAATLRSAGVQYETAGLLDRADFDCLIDCTGDPTAMVDHLDRVGHNGVVALVGAVPHGTRREIDVGRLLTDAVVKNLVFVGSVNADGAAWRAAAEDLAALDRSYPGLPASLITHRLGRSQAPRAFAERAEGEIKAVIDFAAD